jgi:hypothetical protein
MKPSAHFCTHLERNLPDIYWSKRISNKNKNILGYAEYIFLQLLRVYT